MSTAELLAVGGQAFASGLTGIVDKVSIQASAVAPSNTAAASASLVLDGTPQQPTLTLAMRQFDPELTETGNALQCYATRPSSGNPVNSVVVARPGVLSAPLSYPGNSLASVYPGFNAHTQVNPAGDRIVCPSFNANCKVLLWLSGGSAAAFAAGIVAPSIVNAGPGEFFIAGTTGAIYGWSILYA